VKRRFYISHVTLSSDSFDGEDIIVMRMPDVWPALPLDVEQWPTKVEGLDDIIAALERNDRMYPINFWSVSS
jgi:hypothetical protein